MSEHHYTHIGWLLIFAAALSATILRFLLKSRIADRILDLPDRANAMHTNAKPRIGGLGILISAAIVVSVFKPSAYADNAAWGIAFSLLVVSLVDDIRGLHPIWRLMTHFLAVSAFLSLTIYFTQPHLSWLSPGFVCFWLALLLGLVWMVNLFNFMDGADGLAGGMALFGFGSYALVSASAPSIAITSAALAGGALGFLTLNFPPSRLFMGDAGSIPLGFWAGALGLMGVTQHVWAWWFPLIVFSPFIIDASLTLVGGVFRGRRVWLPHREHFYQRLILSGSSHRHVTLRYYALMASSAIFAIAAHFCQGTNWVTFYLIVWVVISTLFFIGASWRLQSSAPNSKL